MPINVTCACGAVYNLKDEYAGTRLACPGCGAAIAVPVPPPAPPVHSQAGDHAFARDKFLLNQRHMSIRERYTVADEEGAPIMFVERPRYIFLNTLAIFAGIVPGVINFLFFNTVVNVLKGSLPLEIVVLLFLWSTLGSVFVTAVCAMALAKKRHVTVYRDDSKGEVLLKVLQDSKIQILTASFTVTDPAGNPVAGINKKYLHNIFRKRWYCSDNSGALLFTAKEDSIILSILRRFMGSFFGLLRTDFIFFDRQQNILGEFNRKLTLLDRYVLDMSPDHLRTVDRRAALAMGVMLDTGEKR